MKNYNKILIFLLTICILTSAFVFSVSAEEETNTIKAGSYRFNDNISYTTQLEIDINFTLPDITEDETTYSFVGAGIGVFKTDGIVSLRYATFVNGAYENFMVYSEGDNSYWNYGNLDTDGFFPEGYGQIIRIETDQTVDDTFATWFNANTELLLCDGSTCPATDMNADNICDDCGMTLSLRLTSYPELPFVSGMFKNSVVLQREDGYFYMALTNDAPYSISGSVADNYLITVAQENEVSYVTYLCTDGKNWVHTNSGKAYSLSVGPSSATLLDSTFDWYKGGELFFQVPLWKEIQGVTQGELTQTTLPTTVGTMKTLVVCGVGLMACLVALSLFGKVLGRYRKK